MSATQQTIREERDGSHDSDARTLLKDALSGRSAAGVEVVRGQRPALLDGDAARALSAPFLAGFMVAAALLRAQIAASPFDLLTLLLRTAAFAFCLRALILIAAFVLRLRKDMNASAHALAFSRDGILWQSPAGERFARRADVIALSVPSVRASRLMLEARRPLLVVTRPETGGLYWALPPYFSASADILRARLERALTLDAGTDDMPPRPPPPEPASERYQRATDGKASKADCVVPEGYSYRLRGPYGVLLGLVFALDALRVAGAQRVILLQPVLLSCLLAISMPLVWLWLMKRKAAARLGIAMLLTPEELVVRGKHGVVSVPYHQLGDVEVRLKDIWSPFVGSYTTRNLIITTKDGATMTFDGGFLGVPPEVVAELCTAYRRGRFAAVEGKAQDAS